MEWFRNKRKRLEMIQGIRPTSKATLKIECLFAAKGDIKEAKELYGFFAEDIPSLPDFDPAPHTWVDTTKATAADLFAWLKDNRDAIATGYEMVRQMTGNRLPPLTLPGMAADAGETVTPLPPINEQA